MGWVKLDDQFADHPKVMQAGPLASWLYVCGLTYCARYLTDGFITVSQVRKLADVDNAAALAEKLVSVGLWDHASGGYAIHDYLDYQPTAEQVKSERDAAKVRMARLRSGEVRENVARTSPPVQSPRTHSHTRTHIHPQERENAREASCEMSSMPTAMGTTITDLSLSPVASQSPEPEPEPPIRDPKAEREMEHALYDAWCAAVDRTPKGLPERKNWTRALMGMHRDIGLGPPGCAPLVASYRAVYHANKHPSPGQVAAVLTQLEQETSSGTDQHSGASNQQTIEARARAEQARIEAKHASIAALAVELAAGQPDTLPPVPRTHPAPVDRLRHAAP